MTESARHVTLRWRRDLVFDGHGTAAASVTIDGDSVAGPSPMESLLLALAACTGSDVVVILRKKRANLQSLTVEVTGERRVAMPKRYVAITLAFRIVAPDLAEAQARRTIELSLEKYCSVAHSLAPDIPVGYELDLHA